MTTFSERFFRDDADLAEVNHEAVPLTFEMLLDTINRWADLPQPSIEDVLAEMHDRPINRWLRGDDSSPQEA